jgi:hypothetical protein
MKQPFAKYQDGKLYHLQGGQYVVDEYGFHLMGLLMTLRALTNEERSRQTERQIQEIQTALRQRRADEGEGG